MLISGPNFWIFDFFRNDIFSDLNTEPDCLQKKVWSTKEYLISWSLLTLTKYYPQRNSKHFAELTLASQKGNSGWNFNTFRIPAPRPFREGFGKASTLPHMLSVCFPDFSRMLLWSFMIWVVQGMEKSGTEPNKCFSFKLKWCFFFEERSFVHYPNPIIDFKLADTIKPMIFINGHSKNLNWIINCRFNELH